MMHNLLDGKETLAIVGIGYVGLRVCIEFAKVYKKVIGFDSDTDRIKELQNRIDRNNDVQLQDTLDSSLIFTDKEDLLRKARFFIVSVPTPVDHNFLPDLNILRNVSEVIGRNLNAGAVVVYESTVYPGVTEEELVPVLERCSGLKCGTDFKVAYSPERVNFGDNEHRLSNTAKVVAAQDDETASLLQEVYGQVVKAGIHKAPDIKTAEAAKIIENIQRDLNLALVNELAMIFRKLGLDFRAVLEAASTKWNFVMYEPGLVGGHCIGVDPYYLAYRALQKGYHPEVILAGRRVNNYMGRFVAQEAVKELLKSGKNMKQAKALVMGLAFKENIGDIRNTRVKDVVDELQEWGVDVRVYDPLVSKQKALREYNITLEDDLFSQKDVDMIILTVKHESFKHIPLEKLRGLCTDAPVLVDVKSMVNKEEAVRLGFNYWRL